MAHASKSKILQSIGPITRGQTDKIYRANPNKRTKTENFNESLTVSSKRSCDFNTPPCQYNMLKDRIPPPLFLSTETEAAESRLDTRKRPRNNTLRELQSSMKNFEGRSFLKSQPSRKLRKEACGILKAWMFCPENVRNPYPTDEEKRQLADEAGISVKQVCNWFVNSRKRLWQPWKLRQGRKDYGETAAVLMSAKNSPDARLLQAERRAACSLLELRNSA